MTDASIVFCSLLFFSLPVCVVICFSTASPVKVESARAESRGKRGSRMFNV